MDVEVGHSIGKYLSKLDVIIAGIFVTVNADQTGITE
jgi:hypothetical protein